MYDFDVVDVVAMRIAKRQGTVRRDEATFIDPYVDVTFDAVSKALAVPKVAGKLPFVGSGRKPKRKLTARQRQARRAKRVIATELGVLGALSAVGSGKVYSDGQGGASVRWGPNGRVATMNLSRSPSGRRTQVTVGARKGGKLPLYYSDKSNVRKPDPSGLLPEMMPDQKRNRVRAFSPGGRSSVSVHSEYNADGGTSGRSIGFDRRGKDGKLTTTVGAGMGRRGGKRVGVVGVSFHGRKPNKSKKWGV
jgi:hypothetical protein